MDRARAARDALRSLVGRVGEAVCRAVQDGVEGAQGRVTASIVAWLLVAFIGLVLVVIVLVGRQRLHRWVLWVPNLLITQLAGRKAAVAIPESDAP